MFGMVFGSRGVPFAPWHTAHICTLGSMLPCACAGAPANAKMTPTAMVVERTRANMVLPRERSWLLDGQVSAHGGEGAIARRTQSARRNAGIGRGRATPDFAQFVLGPTGGRTRGLDPSCIVTARGCVCGYRRRRGRRGDRAGLPSTTAP